MKELCKNIAILFLSCSAVYLASRVEAFTKFNHYLWEEDSLTVAEFSSVEQGQIGGVLPSGIVALKEGQQLGALDLEGTFAPASQVLWEAMGNLEQPRAISEETYCQALEEFSGLYFQWRGDIPLALLAEWVSGGTMLELEGSARGIFLGITGEGVSFYYEEEDGFYQSKAVALTESRLLSVVDQVVGEEKYFAFQKEGLENLWPMTLISYEELRPVVYTATTPYDEGQQALLEVLGFQSTTNTQYTTHDGIVIRSGTDSVRLTYGGLVSYQGEEERRYVLSQQGEEITLLEQVEGCRLFMAEILQTLDTVPELHISSVTEEEEGLMIGFSASLSGIPLSYGGGTRVAEFLVEGDVITQFSLYYRNYFPTESHTPVLPLAQAVAIITGLDAPDSSLMLVYQDQGREQVSATWVIS